jgi:hypothetical protein
MEGFQVMADRHDQALDILKEKVCGLPTWQPTTTITSQPLSNPDGRCGVTLVSRERRLPPPERFDGESGTCLSRSVFPRHGAAAFLLPLGPL